MDGTLRLHGLRAPVDVFRDSWGVPHIYARTAVDALFAQGFVHAQDRLWQLDIQRRTAVGRLSEVLGCRTESIDRWLRVLSVRRVAEEEAASLEGPVREEAEAYARGVNACLGQGRLPVEFRLLRYRPEPWGPADSISWSKVISWVLSANWETELLRARLMDKLGVDLAAELEPRCHDNQKTAGRAGCKDVAAEIIALLEASRASLGDAALRRARDGRAILGPPAGEGLGSNSWVVSGSRTSTGSPFLANDMHLAMMLPSIWYENHLICDDFDVIGVSFPGIPYVVAGHNGRIAWGFTNGFADVQDLYVERLRRSGEGRIEYEFRGEWLQADVIRETIHIRREKPVVEEVVVTRHGPVINGLAPDLCGESPLALRWTSLELGSGIQALAGLNRARTCDQLREALRAWDAPVQNVVYADVEGNIGFCYPGKVPIRSKGEGLVPVPGWTGEYEWEGYIPFDELPRRFNPPEGYIVTANNCTLGESYPYFVSHEFAVDDRARRITELLEARELVDIEYLQSMQFDQVSLSGRVVARCLAELVGDDPELAEVATMLKLWDGAMTADSPQAAVYQAFVRRLAYLLLSGRLGDLAVHYIGRGPMPGLVDSSLYGQRCSEWLLDLLTKPATDEANAWFDLGGGETREEVVRLALRQTVDMLRDRLGGGPADWEWGKLHTLTYTHLLAAAGPLRRFFTRGPYALGGDGTTIWATFGSQHDLGTDLVIGPPYRLIVDLGDVRRSVSLLAPGQSGRPASRHFDDQIEAWFVKGYHPMLFDRRDLEGRTEAALRLVPGR